MSLDSAPLSGSAFAQGQTDLGAASPAISDCPTITLPILLKPERLQDVSR
jgi:hypothetical protein